LRRGERNRRAVKVGRRQWDGDERSLSTGSGLEPLERTQAAKRGAKEKEKKEKGERSEGKRQLAG
jgi:hypothetical protein